MSGDMYSTIYFIIGFLVTCVTYRYFLRAISETEDIDAELGFVLFMLFVVGVLTWPIQILIGIFMFIVFFDFRGKKNG